jgi:hypothetical protein
MPYTTAELDGIVKKLESAIAKGYAEVTHEGNRMVYRTVDEVLKGIAYFKAQYNDATDAPATSKPKTRRLLMHGGNGIGY